MPDSNDSTDSPVSGVHVGLEELVLAEGGLAHGALVGKVSRLQRLLVVLRDVVQELPLVDLKNDYGYWHYWTNSV